MADIDIIKSAAAAAWSGDKVQLVDAVSGHILLQFGKIEGAATQFAITADTFALVRWAKHMFRHELSNLRFAAAYGEGEPEPPAPEGTTVSVGRAQVALTSSEPALSELTGMFVAMSADQDPISYTIIQSNDGGANWFPSSFSPAITNPSFFKNCITYADGRFVVGFAQSGGYWVYVSADGIAWNRKYVFAAGNQITAVAYANDRFLVNASEILIYSTDQGQTWITATSPGANTTSFAYGAGIYIAAKGGIYSSPDLSTWTYRNATVINHVVWNGSMFVAVGNGGELYTSTNGTSWTSRTSGTVQNILRVAWSPTENLWLAITDLANQAIKSSNGTNWTAATTGVSNNTGLYWANGKFIVAGHDSSVLQLSTSVNSSSWSTAVTPFVHTYNNCIVAGGTVDTSVNLLDPYDISYASWTKDSSITVDEDGVLTPTSGADNYISQTFWAARLGDAYEFSCEARSATEFTLRYGVGLATPTNLSVALTASWVPVSVKHVTAVEGVNIYVGGNTTWPAGESLQMRNLALRRMIPIGPNIVVAGSAFDNAAWVTSTVTVGGDHITLTASAGDSMIYQDMTVENGEMYELESEVKTATGSTFDWLVRLNGDTRFAVTPTTVWRKFRFHFKADQTSLRLFIGGWATFTTGEVVQVRNVSVRKMCSSSSQEDYDTIESGYYDRTSWSATATSQFDASYVPANAIDSNTATDWVSQNGLAYPQSISVYLGGLKQFDAVRVTSRNNANGHPYSVKLYGSNNASSWVQIATAYWPLCVNRALAYVYFFLDSPVIYRYIKVETVTGTSGNSGVSEIEVGIDALPDAPESGHIPRDGWLVVADSYFSLSGNYKPQQAIDANTATCWTSGNGIPYPHYFEITFQTSRTFDYVEYVPRQDTPQNPTTVEIYVSDDGVTWGSAIKTVNWTGNTTDTQFCYLDAPVTSRFVKIKGTAGLSGFMSAAEIYLGKQ